MTKRIRLCYTETDSHGNTELDIDISSEKCDNHETVELLRRFLRAAGYCIDVDEMPETNLVFDDGFEIQDYDPQN